MTHATEAITEAAKKAIRDLELDVLDPSVRAEPCLLVLDRARRGNEAVHLPIFPLREGVRLQVKIDAPRGDDLGPYNLAADLPRAQLVHRRFVETDERTQRPGDQVQFLFF